MTLSTLHPTSRGYLAKRFVRAQEAVERATIRVAALPAPEGALFERLVREVNVDLQEARTVLLENSNNDMIQEVAEVCSTMLSIASYVEGRTTHPGPKAPRTSRRTGWDKGVALLTLESVREALDNGLRELEAPGCPLTSRGLRTSPCSHPGDV